MRADNGCKTEESWEALGALEAVVSRGPEPKAERGHPSIGRHSVEDTSCHRLCGSLADTLLDAKETLLKCLLISQRKRTCGVVVFQSEAWAMKESMIILCSGR